MNKYVVVICKDKQEFSNKVDLINNDIRGDYEYVFSSFDGDYKKLIIELDDCAAVVIAGRQLDQKDVFVKVLSDLNERLSGNVVLVARSNHPHLSLARRIGLTNIVYNSKGHMGTHIEQALKFSKHKNFMRECPPFKYMDKYSVPVVGVIHVGAHEAQEIPYYSKIDGDVVYLEAISDLIDKIAPKINGTNIKIIEGCCSDVDDEKVTFNVSNNGGGASSFLSKPDDPYEWVSRAVKFESEFETQTVRLDTALNSHGFEPERFNLLVIDVQGADLKVLKGAGEFLSAVDGVYVEVSPRPLYKGGCTTTEIVQFMDECGFGVMDIDGANRFWGDAFFLNRKWSGSRIADKNLINASHLSSSSVANENMDVAQLLDGAFDVSKGVFSTRTERNPWIRVDFDEPQSVSQLQVYFHSPSRDLLVPLRISISRDRDEFDVIYERRDNFAFEHRYFSVNIDETIKSVRLEIPNTGKIALCQLVALP